MFASCQMMEDSWQRHWYQPQNHWHPDSPDARGTFVRNTTVTSTRVIMTTIRDVEAHALTALSRNELTEARRQIQILSQRGRQGWRAFYDLRTRMVAWVILAWRADPNVLCFNQGTVCSLCQSDEHAGLKCHTICERGRWLCGSCLDTWLRHEARCPFCSANVRMSDFSQHTFEGMVIEEADADGQQDLSESSSRHQSTPEPTHRLDRLAAESLLNVQRYRDMFPEITTRQQARAFLSYFKEDHSLSWLDIVNWFNVASGSGYSVSHVSNWARGSRESVPVSNLAIGVINRRMVWLRNSA